MERMAMPDFRFYPTPFVHIIRWSKFWGCFPVTYCKAQHSWKLSPLLVFWMVCSIGFNVPTFYDCIKTSVVNDNSLTLYVMILIVGVMSISAVSTHVLSIVHHDCWSEFLNNWMMYEKKFPHLTVGVHSRRLSIPLFFGFLLCIIFFVVNIFNELRFNLMKNEGAGRMLSLVYVYVIYSYTLSTPVLWIVMVSKVISFGLVHIRKQLDSINECLSFGFRCSASPVQKCISTEDLNTIQEAVMDLTHLIGSFKNIIGPFMFVIIPHHIISLICFLYWTIVSMLDYTDWYLTLSFGLLSAQAIIPIFCGAIYSEDIENKKRGLIGPLLILKGCMLDIFAKAKLTTLIDHLDRFDAQIDGGGFFKLNKGMATTVANTVVTYLVVLIQFYGGSQA